jgi:hypothetical protein
MDYGGARMAMNDLDWTATKSAASEVGDKFPSEV